MFVDHTASLGGGELALLNLVRHVDRRRYVPIAVLFAQGPLGDRLRAAGVECHTLPLDDGVLGVRKDSIGFATLLRVAMVFRVLAHAMRLARFIRQHRIDLVHANSLKSDLVAGVAALVAGRPVIWHVRDRIAHDYLPRPVVWAFRRLARVVPTYVLANSRATLATLELRSERRTAHVYSGVDLTTGRRAEERREPSLAARGPLVGLVGRISPWKGQHVFLRAAAQVRVRFPDARFQIIGAALFSEREYEEEVRRLAVDLGLGDAVEFTGFRSDVPALVSRLDLLVHASTTGEPFGQVLVEGMAAQKAVVATNGGGVPEIVAHGETGLLVPMDDADAMADAIGTLLADAPLRLRMGRMGHRRVLEHFTIQHTANRVQEVYERVLGNRELVRRSA